MKKNWYKPKGYTHFTKKLTIQNAGSVNTYISYPQNISNHKFYPLIHKTIVEKKYKIVAKDPQEKPVRKHYRIENGKRKTTAKYRDIFYPSHLDAHVYSFYTQNILSPIYEDILSKKENSALNDSVIAYRRIKVSNENRHKCNIDFANEIFEIIKHLKGNYTVLAFDISKFFDSLNHNILKQKWCRLLGRKDLPEDHYKIYKSLTDFHFVEMQSILEEFGYKHSNQLIEKDVSRLVTTGDEFRKRIVQKGLIKPHPFKNKNTGERLGIPQGTPISAFLANLCMLDYDREILNRITDSSFYRRYSDDILVICPTHLEKEIEDFVIEKIADPKLCGLEIQRGKTQKTRFVNGKLLPSEQPVKYLGFEFDGITKRVKSASISKYYRKMKKSIKYRAGAALKMRRKHARRAFIYRKPIYKGYSHLGATRSSNRKRNYLSYINLATQVMGEKKIKKQLSRSWQKINGEVKRYEKKFGLEK